jgi:uncharacterized cupin superfamily protein
MPALAFARQTTTPESDHPRAERLINGNPLRTTWNHYTNDSGEVYAGVWACEVGSWRIEMGDREDEFFFVTAGRCRLTDDNGVAVEIGPGESVVIPAGFKGTFAVLESMKKHYMIVDRMAHTL